MGAEGPVYHARQSRADIGAALPQRHHVTAPGGEHNGQRSGSLEGPDTSGGFVEHHSDRPYVRGHGGRGAGGPLRGQITGGADHHGGGGGLAVGRLVGLGDAEVGQFGGAVTIYQHVGGLDVAVHDSRRMGRAQPGQDVEPGSAHPVLGQGAGPYPFGQSPAGDQLHDQVRVAALLPDVIDADHVGMRQASRGPALGCEPTADHWVGRLIGSQHLDGDIAVQPLVPGQEHLCHTPSGQPKANPVPSAEQPTSRHRCQRRRHRLYIFPQQGPQHTPQWSWSDPLRATTSAMRRPSRVDRTVA